MDFAAIRHRSDKNYCYALEEGRFLFRIQVKRGDIKKVILHYQDKYVSTQLFDTRAKAEMIKVSYDAYHDYYEIELAFDVICLRYFFELEDMEGNRIYYSNYLFMDQKPNHIDHMFNVPQKLREEEMFVVPDWAANKVVYQIFPSRFATSKQVPEETWYKAPISFKDDLQGDLRGIINRLEHLKELGVEVLYMTPIFLSDTCHKYDTIDYYTIDPSFGTKEDLKELVEKAHDMGMKVLLDAVYNHTGTKFFAFADIEKNGADSKYVDWYHIEGFPLKSGWGIKPNFLTFAYFGGMPKLNLSNREVQDYVIGVARYWIQECDIDGWRLDVGDEVSHKFWKRFREEVKSVKEDALIVGEVWYYANDFLEGDEWDTVMNYPFYDAVLDLVAHNKITVSEFAERIGFLKGNLHKKVYPVLFNLIDSHDTPRFLHSCGNDFVKQKLGAAFQLLLPGMPMIYYGDEFGMQGAHDPDCRRGMYWDEQYQNLDMFAWYQKLISVRKKYQCITEGETVHFKTDDAKATIEVTRKSGKEQVTLVFNCSNEKREMAQYKGLKNLASDKGFEGWLEPYETVVLEG